LVNCPYVERPRAQLQYYERGGSRSIAYGLGDEGGALLRREDGTDIRFVSWNEKNTAIGRLFLEHALLVSDVMVTIELACRRHGYVRLIHEDQLSLPSQWRVKIQNGPRLGVIPDRIFALECIDQDGKTERAYFFLEADRGTMPVRGIIVRRIKAKAFLKRVSRLTLIRLTKVPFPCGSGVWSSPATAG